MIPKITGVTTFKPLSERIFPMFTVKRFLLLFTLGLTALLTAQELVRNGSFETVPPGKSLPSAWTLTKAFAGKIDGNAADGQNCFKLDNPGGGGILIQSLKLSPGKTYTLSWQVKAAQPGQKFMLYIEYSTHTKRFAGTRWGSGTAGTSWEKKSMTFSLPDDVRYSTLVLRQVKDSGVIWFDDFKMSESTAPVPPPAPAVPGKVDLQKTWQPQSYHGTPKITITPEAAAIALTGPKDNGRLFQKVKVKPQTDYILSVDYRNSPDAKGTIYLMANGKRERLTRLIPSAVTGRKSLRFTTEANEKQINVFVVFLNGSGEVSILSAELTEDTGRPADTVLNPGFEQNLSGWETDKPQTVKTDSSNAKEGKYSLLFTDRGTLTQEGIPVSRNTRYRLTANVMCAEFNHPYRFFVGWKAEKSGSTGGITQKFGLERQDGFTAWQNKSIEFVTPVKPFSGMYITLENLAPGKVWFDNIRLEKIGDPASDPLIITLTSPAYRNTIYSSQPEPEISGNLKFNREVKFPVNADFDLTDASGKKILSKTISISGNNGFFRLPLDTAALPDGKYFLKAAIRQNTPEIIQQQQLEINKVAKADFEVIPDAGNFLRINGQSFFPIGLYEPDFTENDFRQYNRFGFNTLLYMSSNAASVKLVADKAMQYNLKVISHYITTGNEITQHPAFLGYHNADEPAWMGSDRDTLVKKYRRMRDIDPYHPVWTNHAPRNDIETLKLYNEGCDISGVDIYPVTSSPNGSDHSDLADRTISCVGKYALKMRKTVDDCKPVFMVLQGFAWAHLRNANAPGARYPDYTETRFMVWDSIIHGANGIFYYATNRMAPDHRLWLDMAKVNHEVQSLAAIITSPAGRKCGISNPLVAAATRDFDGNPVIFMANTAKTPQRATVTFPEFGERCFELYRAAPVSLQQGKFEVSLAPYEVKVFSGKPLKTNFSPAKNYTFEKNSITSDCREIPFENIGSGIMGYNWRGAWLWSTSRPFAPKAYLRKKFNVKGDLKSAFIAISADAKYRLLVNGREVGSGACCWVAQTYDIAKFLHPGDNIIAIEGFGDGGPTGLLFEGKITAGESSEYFISDQTWKSSAEAAANSYAPDFDDRNWQPATVAYEVSKGVWGRIPVIP